MATFKQLEHDKEITNTGKSEFGKKDGNANKHNEKNVHSDEYSITSNDGMNEYDSGKMSEDNGNFELNGRNESDVKNEEEVMMDDAQNEQTENSVDKDHDNTNDNEKSDDIGINEDDVSRVSIEDEMDSTIDHKTLIVRKEKDIS